MKNLLIAFAVLTGFFSNAQKINIKKDDVLLDGKPFLKYEKINLSEYSIRDLQGNEVLFYQIKESHDAYAAPYTYVVFNFVGEKRKVASESGPSGLGAKNMMEKVIAWLVKDKVFNADGTINNEALDVFADKYNDHKN